MYTAFYRLDSTGYQHELAHLYEHLLLLGFYAHAESHGYNPGLIGWLNGDTFDTCIYLDAGFYDPQVLTLFHDYIASNPQFSAQGIERALAVISAEERALTTPTHNLTFNKELQALSALKWNDGTQTAIIPHEPQRVLDVRKQATKYRDITFDIYVEGLTENEAKVLQRLSVMLLDTAFVGLQQQYAVYYRDSTFMKDYEPGGMQATCTFTVPRGVTTARHYQQTVIEALEALNTAEQYKQILCHIDTYSKEPFWKALAVEYYRHAGIVTTVEEIRALMSPTLISSIIAKTRVYAHETPKTMTS